jgi:hypothetical protein
MVSTVLQEEGRGERKRSEVRGTKRTRKSVTVPALVYSAFVDAAHSSPGTESQRDRGRRGEGGKLRSSSCAVECRW